MKDTFVSLIIIFLLLVFVGSCTPLEGSNAKGSIALDKWIKNYIEKTEKLLCKRDVKGEFYFIARIGDKIKVGSRIDVAGAGRVPKTLIAGWLFKNEKDEHLVTNIQPTTIRETYVRDNNRIYAERIEVQTLYLKGSQKLHAAISIKKCAGENCRRDKTVSAEEEVYSVDVCEISLQ